MEDRDTNPDPSDARRPYEPPELIELGSLRELTKGFTTPGPDDLETGGSQI